MKYLLFPLVLSAGGIFASFLASIHGIFYYKVKEVHQIEIALKYQLLLSTAFVFVTIIIIAHSILPYSWY